MQIEGNYPTHYRKYNRSLSFEKRVDFVVSMLNLDDPPSFLAAYFHEPDHTGHRFGPDSPEVENVIRRMDNVTGYLLENLRNLGLWNQVCCHAKGDLTVSLFLSSFPCCLSKLFILLPGSMGRRL